MKEKEEIIELIKESKRNIKVADHIVNVTYKVIKDEKLLINVLRKIRVAIRLIIKAFILVEKSKKKLVAIDFDKDAERAISTFKIKVAPKYGIEKKFIRLITVVEEMLHTYEKSSLNIVKNNQIYIAQEDYTLRVINQNDVKKYINITKDFIWHSEFILKKEIGVKND